MKLKLNALMIIALCGITVTACGNKKSSTKVSGSPYAALNGREAKKTYESLTTTGIASLNYLQTSAAANARHFANFVDGLLTHNEFGVLELNLAESASHNEDYTEFSFKVRDDENLVWSTYEGKPYSYNGEVQKVKASDFATGAKTVCTYSTGSDTFYLLRDFIKGALEYYLYTQILDGQAQGTKEFTNLTTDAKKANWIQKKIKSDNPSVFKAGGYDETPLEAADINNIANGSRFGVVANDSTRIVTYQLMNPAVYFPTLLTYSCYLPVNANFLAEKKSSFGTSAKDSILYNGPFYLSQLDETNIIYSKNQNYAKRADLHGYNSVHVDNIKYNIIRSDIDSTYTRTQFEAGNIDGFSLSMNDTEGWTKYVVGPDGSGTIADPYDGLVNSRLLDTIGYAYGTNIVMERTKNSNSAKSYASAGSASQIANTERALRIQSVRQAIMAAFDYPTYFQRYADGDSESVFASQMLVHTYVPKNFVYDNNGNEYTQTYYAGALSKAKGISLGEAQELIKTGTWEHRQQSQDSINIAVSKAMADIETYNASEFATTYGTISLPITLEYFSLWYDQETKTYDTLMIEAMNKRLNNVTSVAANYANCDKFKVIPTDKVDSSNYSTVDGQSSGAAAFDFSAHMWGWGADYGDPLTYLNTYTVGGDWSSIFYFISMENVPNITFNAGVGSVSNLLADYTALVRKGQDENENFTKRYQYFAEAEVKLINELAIYMPQTNDGQGWSLSISKSAGYEVPTANYGLSDSRLTGLWVLTKPLTREERTSIRAEYDANKQAYTSSHPTYNIYG